MRIGLVFDPRSRNRRDFKWLSDGQVLPTDGDKFNRWGYKYSRTDSEPNQMTGRDPEQITVSDADNKIWRTRKARDTFYPLVCEQRKAVLINTPSPPSPSPISPRYLV